ncbi:long-chain fatty acid--CoA ligase [Streptomyces sp. NPDC003077]|uniref:long-chain-fatty-acid--CoA ligase n=1 Tax=Streptomyces sp. NPDC003077 TaxID=3154443 RepID=UPI0033B7BA47
MAESAARRPGHTALIAGPERLTYAALWNGALRYASVLRTRGIGPGDRVALLLDNTPHFPMAYYAALALGATVVPVNVLLKAEEIAYVLGHSGAKMLLCGRSLLGEGEPAAHTSGATLLIVGGEETRADGRREVHYGDGGGAEDDDEAEDKDEDEAEPTEGVRAPSEVVVPGGVRGPSEVVAPGGVHGSSEVVAQEGVHDPSEELTPEDVHGPSLDALAAHACPLDEAPVPRAPDDTAVILYTSGTTGRPKGVMITHCNLIANIETTMVSPFDMRPDDVLLGCLPLFHTFGQICGMGTCFRAGATMVLTRRFTAEGALELMRAERCTVLMGVPTMYVALLEAAARQPDRPRLDRPRLDRPRLDRAYSGGSALPVRVLEEFEAAFGCPIYEGYGLTETSPCVAYNQKAWPRRPGTVGKPIRGVRAEIARADAEHRIELLPPGEVGEIVVRGHNVMAGYLDDPEATAAAIVDGWFRSGDLGVKDADGYLSVVDRKKDMIIRGGYNVYPREVEETLVHHPAVAHAAVIGLPDARHGQEICAVIVPRPHIARPDPALAEDIVRWTKQRIAAYKYPRRVEFVDSLPLGPSGKVLKRELLARFGDGRPGL